MFELLCSLNVTRFHAIPILKYIVLQAWICRSQWKLTRYALEVLAGSLQNYTLCLGHQRELEVVSTNYQMRFRVSVCIYTLQDFNKKISAYLFNLLTCEAAYL